MWAVSKGGACETCFDTVAILSSEAAAHRRGDLLSTYGALVPVELNRHVSVAALRPQQILGSSSPDGEPSTREVPMAVLTVTRPGGAGRTSPIMSASPP